MEYKLDFTGKFMENVIKKAMLVDNVIPYTPKEDYNPSTKKYVDDAIKGIDIDVDIQYIFKNISVENDLISIDHTTSKYTKVTLMNEIDEYNLTISGTKDGDEGYIVIQQIGYKIINLDPSITGYVRMPKDDNGVIIVTYNNINGVVFARQDVYVGDEQGNLVADADGVEVGKKYVFVPEENNTPKGRLVELVIPGVSDNMVSVAPDNLVSGKKYLFVPDNDASPIGSFVEYSGTEISDNIVQVNLEGLIAGKKYLFVPDVDGSSVGKFIEYEEYKPNNKLVVADAAGTVHGKQYVYTPSSDGSQQGSFVELTASGEGSASSYVLAIGSGNTVDANAYAEVSKAIIDKTPIYIQIQSSALYYPSKITKEANTISFVFFSAYNRYSTVELTEGVTVAEYYSNNIVNKANTSADGLMSKEDKVRIDGLTQSITQSIQDHNADAEAHKPIRDKVAEVEAIARGRSRAKVFDTVADLDTWLESPENKETLQIGDNFYIIELDVPDYWYDGTDKQPIEGDKVDLSGYVEEAASDGKTYGRNNGLWKELNIPSPEIHVGTEEPTGDESVWIDTDDNELFDDYAVPEAPIDNRRYVRKNRGWVAIDPEVPIISKVIQDDNITDPENITGDVNGFIIQQIRSKIRRCLAKKNAEGEMTICYLDPKNSNLYNNNTEAVLDGTEGDVMVYFPKYYYKYESLGENKFSISYSLAKIDNTWTEVPEYLLGAYEAYKLNDKLYSRSGVLSTGSVSQDNFKIHSRARGKGYQLIDYDQHKMIAWLFYAIYGNRNCQSICGSGTSDYQKPTGQTNSIGDADTDSVNGNTMSVNFLGLENCWGNKYEFLDNVIVNPSSNDGVWRIADTVTGATRDVAGVVPNNAWHWPKTVVAGVDLDIVVKEGGMGETTGYCDGQYLSASSSRVVLRSYYDANAFGGVAYADASYGSSGANAFYGSRLSFRGIIHKIDNINDFKAIPITN